jgi:hypothetical protein
MKQKYRLKMGSEIHAHVRDAGFTAGPRWVTVRTVKDCMYTADEFLHTALEVRDNMSVVCGLVEYQLSGMHDLNVLLQDRVYINLWGYPHAEYDGFLVDIVLLEKYD